MSAVVACVGTTHPLATAGLLLECAVIRSLGARPVAVVAGVSAQTAGAVSAREPVTPATIAAQFDALSGTGVGAFSVGALLDAASVRAVAAGLRGFPGVPVVCDPVVAASGGDRLADDATVAALREDLFAACTLVTPNVPEAAVLTGAAVATLAGVLAAIPALLALGPAAVLVKGGHLTGDAVDVFADRSGVRELRAPRLPETLRGTGSLLGAAVATHCARGAMLLDAVIAGRAFVREAITAGVPFAGMRVAP
jgi:hydroxymethylpyrimidine/phosphomethylpyrimidine kinase